MVVTYQIASTYGGRVQYLLCRRRILQPVSVRYQLKLNHYLLHLVHCVQYSTFSDFLHLNTAVWRTYYGLSVSE